MRDQCSFCYRTTGGRIVRGPGSVAICESCVDMCVDILAPRPTVAEEIAAEKEEALIAACIEQAQQKVRVVREITEKIGEQVKRDMQNMPIISEGALASQLQRAGLAEDTIQKFLAFRKGEA